MKKLFSLLTLALLTLSAVAATTVTIDFTGQNYSNGQAVTTLTIDGVTVTFGQGTNSNNAPKYYTSGTAIRLYVGNTMSVTAGRNITNIEFTNQDSYPWPSNSCSTGEFDETGAWVGSSSAITFTNTNSGNTQVRVQKMVVTLADPSGDFVAAPVFEPNSKNFVGSIEVALTCATDGAEIIYTLNNGDEITYTAPFTLTETTTVKAYAQTDDAESEMAEATYTLLPGYATLQEVNALADSTDFGFTGNVIAVYQNGSNLWVKDNTGYGLIYGNRVPAIAEGKTIKSGWDAKRVIYHDYINEYVFPNNVEATDAEAITIEPTEYTVADITTEKINERVILKGVTLAAGNGDKYLIADETLTIYNQFNIAYPTDLENKTFNVEGMVSYYNGIQVMPITITNAEGGIITVNKPSISPATQNFTESITVTITAEEGATILYNFDNGDTWNTYTEPLVLTETTTVYAKAKKDDVESEVAHATYTKLEAAEDQTFTLVTSTDDLADGDQIIFVGKKGDDQVPYVMAEQRGNNFGATEVEFNEDGTITTGYANIITLGAVEGGWSLHVKEGYLYAAGSSSNWMRAQEEVDENAIATITIGDETTIVFTQSSNRNIVRFNANNNPPLFSCYANYNQNPVYIYKLVQDQPEVKLGDVNKDGVIRIDDVTALIDALLGGNTDVETEHYSPANADVNQDTFIRIDDVTALIDMLLSGAAK